MLTVFSRVAAMVEHVHLGAQHETGQNSPFVALKGELLLWDCVLEIAKGNCALFEHAIKTIQLSTPRPCE